MIVKEFVFEETAWIYYALAYLQLYRGKEAMGLLVNYVSLPTLLKEFRASSTSR